MTARSLILSRPTRQHWPLMLVPLLLIALGLLLPPANDWHHIYRPVARLVLAGHSPYEHPSFYNPPWIVLPLLPLALLPARLGQALLFVANLLSCAVVAVQLGAGSLALAAFLLSPPVVYLLVLGNLDGLALLGAALPPPLGLFFILVKPQIGLLLALFWLVEAWHAGGLRRVAATFAPVTLAMLASFVLFGLWPLRAPHLADVPWNASLWPLSIPAGLALVALSLYRGSPHPALAAGACLSPYVSFQSWSAALVALARRPWLLVATSAGLWALIVWQLTSTH